MIFVDTSVWVTYFRGRDPRLADTLERLLDDDQVGLAAPVRLELLGGASAASHSSLRRSLAALPVFYPTRDTWSLVDRWVERAVARGERFGMGDLLIGAIAAERGSPIWSLDHDFARLARLKLLKLFSPPRSH
ncbi:MAG: PIN domain-containing protein [Myxococcota bacterium]